MTTGDTKAGTLIGVDRFGNKYFENMAEELPCEFRGIFHSLLNSSIVDGFVFLLVRTRWVDYKEPEYDPSQIEPGW